MVINPRLVCLTARVCEACASIIHVVARFPVLGCYQPLYSASTGAKHDWGSVLSAGVLGFITGIHAWLLPQGLLSHADGCCTCTSIHSAYRSMRMLRG
jgi:hypothetical protein